MTAISDNSAINKALGNVPDEMLDNGRVSLVHRPSPGALYLKVEMQVVNPFIGLASATGYPATNDAELALLDGGLGVGLFALC